MKRRQRLWLASILIFTLALGFGLGDLNGRRFPTPIGVLIIDCSDGTPQCPPDDQRVVVAQWSDGQTRLSTYDPHTGWNSPSPWVGRDHVTRWWELPGDSVAANQ